MVTGTSVVVSKLSYPKEYTVTPIKEQIRILGELFSLKTEGALEQASHLPPLFTGAQGWFAIPNVFALQKNFSSLRECENVLLKRGFKAFNETFSLSLEKIFKEPFSKKEKTNETLKKVFRHQKRSEIAIIGAQTGASHRGQSGTKITKEIEFKNNEFELDLLSVLSILCTNEKRIATGNDNTLGIICSGAFFEDHDGTLQHPIFYNQSSITIVGKQDPDQPDKRLGGATGFWC